MTINPGVDYHTDAVVIRCNGKGCGSYLNVSTDTPERARRRASAQGWHQQQGPRSIRDYCPRCRSSHG